MPVRASNLVALQGRSCHRSVPQCNELIHLRRGCCPHYIWWWRLSLLQHPKHHCRSDCISRLIAKPPRAGLKRGVRPFKSSSGIENAAVLELAIDENVLLDNESGTHYRVIFVNRDWHGNFLQDRAIVKL